MAPVTKSGAFTVAVNPPSEVTSPLTVTPFGSGAFSVLSFRGKAHEADDEQGWLRQRWKLS